MIKLSGNKTKMMGRTLEGTIFEIVFVVMALALWGYIAWLISQAPHYVPTHFDAVGKADGYGKPTLVIFPCLMMTVVGACMLLGAYFPGSVNLPVKVETPRQMSLVMRMMRILSLVFLLLALATAFSTLNIAQAWPVWPVVGILVAVVIVFTILIYRAR